MRDRTVVALFDKFANAQAAVGDLIQIGAPRDRISLLANDTTGDHPGLLVNPAYAREEVDADSQAQPGALVGAEVGIGLGGVLGFLVGIGTIAIPGIGGLIAAGAWVAIAAGAAAGGIIGGAIGALTSHGISDKDAHLYAEGLRRGGTLVTVVVPEGDTEKMTEILRRHGAVDIEKRGAAWQAEGWVSFDPGADPLTADEIAAARATHVDADHAAEHHHAVRHYVHPASDAAPPGGASNQTTAYGEDETRPR